MYVLFSCPLPVLSDEQMRELVFVLKNKIDGVETVNSNLVSTITQLERQNMDLRGNLSNALGESADLKSNISSLELRLLKVEQALEQERKENNVTDSDVLKMITDLENQVSNITATSGINSNPNAAIVAPNCSCCSGYADLANDVGQLQVDQSDLLKELQESITNQTAVTSQLLVFDSKVDSAMLKIDVLQKSEANQSLEISKLDTTLKGMCGLLKFQGKKDIHYSINVYVVEKRS